jgi:hypothetical protein
MPPTEGHFRREPALRDARLEGRRKTERGFAQNIIRR